MHACNLTCPPYYCALQIASLMILYKRTYNSNSKLFLSLLFLATQQKITDIRKIPKTMTANTAAGITMYSKMLSSSLLRSTVIC